MTHFFEKRDPWGNGLALWVLLGMTFLVPVAVWGITYLEMENEVHTWIAQDNPQTKAYHWYKSHFSQDDTVLFTWDGSGLNDPRVDQFVARIRGVVGEDGVARGALKQVKRVRSPSELIDQMTNHKISREDAIQRLEGVLVGRGNLRVRLSPAGRDQRQKVIDALERRAHDVLGLSLVVSDATSTGGEFQGIAAADSADGSSADIAGEHDFQISWTGMQSQTEHVRRFRELALELRLPPGKAGVEPEPMVEQCAFVSGSPVALAISLSDAGMAERKKTFRELKQIAADVGIPENAIHMGGGPVAGAALNEGVLKAIWDVEQPVYLPHRRSVVLVSWLVGVILAFWLLRSVRLAALVLGISYFTTLVATSFVPLSGGSMNMVLVVMPTLLLVTTLSGAIHLANYWKHAAHRDSASAVVTAVKMARSPCIWASLTTAIGLASLVTSSLKPVRDFGLYSALGTLISLAAILYGLPALLQLWPSHAPRPKDDDTAGWRSFGAWIVLRARPIMAASFLFSTASIYGLVYFRTETKVIRYFSDEADIVADYRFIEQNLAGVLPVDIIVRFDTAAQDEHKFLERQEMVRTIATGIRGLPDVSGAISLADFLPSAAAPPADANMRQRAAFAATSRATEERVKHDTEGRARAFLAQADERSEFNAPGDELWRITAQAAIMSNLHYGTLTRQIDEVCQSTLRGTAGHSDEKFRASGTAVAYHPGGSHVVTGMVPLFLATQEELLNSLLNSFLLAFVTIAVVLMCLLRHPVAGILAMVPNILPIGAVFGLIAWAGLAVDIGTIVTASIALGIAVDGTLHLVTWFRLNIRDGKQRTAAVVDAMAHCGPAMWQTSLVVGLGLLVLYPSELVLISRFGWLMASLIGAALVADLVLTPALLVGPLGALLERVEQRAAALSLPAPVETAANEPVAALPLLTDGPHEHKPHLEPAVSRVRRRDRSKL